MNRKSGSGSGIFLMEMMVVVFFFILCASTCILAFARSDSMSRLAMERNQAVLAAQSVVEVWKADGTEGWGAQFGGAEEVQPEHWSMSWDARWKPTAEAGAPYRADVVLTTTDHAVEHAAVSVYRSSDQTQLFTLEADCYRP